MRKPGFRFPPPVDLPDSDSLKDFEPLTDSEIRQMRWSPGFIRYADKYWKYQRTYKPPFRKRVVSFVKAHPGEVIGLLSAAIGLLTAFLSKT